VPLILLPAVDVVEGRAVRLVQGRAGSETEYGSALDAALGWQRDGAEWVHLVDLDVQIVDGDHRLRGRGWETDGGDLWEVLERLDSEGCSRFVVTDVTKDGTLTGPNLGLLRAVAERTDVPVIASGGVSSLDDLRAIATLTGSGVEGAIVGKALYAGRFSLPQAFAAVAG